MDCSALKPEQQQQVAAQYLQQNPPPPSTLNMTVHDLQNIIQTVSAKTLETLHSTREADSMSVLPKHVRSLQKPRQFDCKETSGKFKNAISLVVSHLRAPLGGRARCAGGKPTTQLAVQRPSGPTISVVIYKY